MSKSLQKYIQSISKSYVNSTSSFAETATFSYDDIYDENAEETYTLSFLNGSATISGVQDCEDGIAKATEYVREIFPRSYSEAEWFILNAGYSFRSKEETWKKLFPYIWDAVVEELREDIEYAWFLMELGKKSDAEHLTAVLNLSF